jgi:hypothetical protein
MSSEDHQRLRTRLATYAIALVAIPLGFAWGYLSANWPIRHRLWALWLVTPLVWGWTRLARLAWATILHWVLGVGFVVSGATAVQVSGHLLWHTLMAPTPSVSTPAVQSPHYPPLSDTAQAAVAQGLLTPTGEVVPMVRELLREKYVEGWSVAQMIRMLQEHWGSEVATEVVSHWFVTDTVLTPEGTLVLTPAPAMPTSEPRHRAVVR